MVRPMLVFLAVGSVGVSASLQAQPADPGQGTRTAARSQARPVNVTVKVTDGAGLGIEDVTVSITGPVTREGTTVADGSFRALGLKPGTYRYHFEREGFVTLERDVVIKAGATGDLDVMLTRAPAAPEPEAPPPTPVVAETHTSAPLPPASFDVSGYLEREYLKSGGNRVKSISCSDTDSVSVVQTTTSYAVAAGPRQLVAVAIAGQGKVAVNGRSSTIDSREGTTVVVPAGSSFEATRQGRSTLVFVLIRLGSGCGDDNADGGR